MFGMVGKRNNSTPLYEFLRLMRRFNLSAIIFPQRDLTSKRNRILDE